MITKRNYLTPFDSRTFDDPNNQQQFVFSFRIKIGLKRKFTFAMNVQHEIYDSSLSQTRANKN